MSQDSTALLDLWAQGQGHGFGARALLMLGEGAEAMSLGARDAALLRLRRSLFGDGIAALAECPHCRAQAELSLSHAALDAEVARAGSAPESFTMEARGYHLACRPLRAADVPALESMRDPARIAAEVLTRCVLSATRDGNAVPAAMLPEAVRVEVAEALLAADPCAELLMDLTCADCAATWQVGFDPATFLWQEFESWALRTMEEVHHLASVHGWSERDCLAIPPARRAVYVALAGR